jgi:hypothetical protein
MKDLSWQLCRIGKMPVAEYPYRIRQAINMMIDSHFIKGVNFPDYAGYLAEIKRVDISRFKDFFPHALSQAIYLAEDILRHRFNVFGIEKDFGNPINWHLDPKTDKSWPLDFWGDIDYRDGETTGGIKFAWELNRLHHLPRLALADLLTGDSRYRDEIFSQIDSWLKGNPYPKGINWIMSVESGIRIINIIYTLKLFTDHPPLTQSQSKLIGDFVLLHGKHLYRYRSRYTSGANHAIAEALGLFAAGLCFPGIGFSAQWKRVGKQVIEKEIIRQIYPDGSSFEHSIPYLQFVVDHVLIYYLLCQEYREPCNPIVVGRLRSSLKFIRDILDKNGNFPRIGDEDDGYLLKLWYGSHNNFRSLLNTGAVLFNDASLIPENAELDQKTVLLLGPGSIEKWAELNNNKIDDHAPKRYFPQAGLAVIHDSEAGNEVAFVGNSGPLGLKPLAAHGHADALSFWLSVNGEPIFVDPGPYLYHGGRPWRDYFRSTSAHNTIKIDGLDQAKTVSDFMFGSFYSIIAPGLRESGEGYLWTAGHDAYLKLKDPVFHKRDIFFQANGKKILIDDHIMCEEKHLVESFFHFHPDIGVINHDQCIWIEFGRVKARMRVDDKWQVMEIVRGSLNPLLGWYSPKFNHIQAASTLRLSSEITGNRVFHTEILLN